MRRSKLLREEGTPHPKITLSCCEPKGTGKALWNPEQSDGESPSRCAPGIARPCGFPMRGEREHAAREKGLRPLGLGQRKEMEAVYTPRPVENAKASGKHADALYGSSRTKAAAQDQSRADGEARSPDAVLLWRGHSIDTARAVDTGGNVKALP